MIVAFLSSFADRIHDRVRSANIALRVTRNGKRTRSELLWTHLLADTFELRQDEVRKRNALLCRSRLELAMNRVRDVTSSMFACAAHVKARLLVDSRGLTSHAGR